MIWDLKKVEKSLSKGVFKLGSVTGKLSEESRTNLRKVASLSLGPAGIVGGGSECTALSIFNTTTRHCSQLLPEQRSTNGCPLLRVCVDGVYVCSLLCVCTWMGKCRARIPSMGQHTWLYVTSRHIKKIIVCILPSTPLELRSDGRLL